MLILLIRESWRDGGLWTHTGPREWQLNRQNDSCIDTHTYFAYTHTVGGFSRNQICKCTLLFAAVDAECRGKHQLTHDVCTQTHTSRFISTLQNFLFNATNRQIGQKAVVRGLQCRSWCHRTTVCQRDGAPQPPRLRSPVQRPRSCELTWTRRSIWSTDSKEINYLRLHVNKQPMNHVLKHDDWNRT